MEREGEASVDVAGGPMRLIKNSQVEEKPDR